MMEAPSPISCFLTVVIQTAMSWFQFGPRQLIGSNASNG
ncbi:unnamed protein product [Tenebrio molitor]|nr:unnamed protein product [Tenebrio molitor]